jgi:quinoprotein glucose dehydrogenase
MNRLVIGVFASATVVGAIVTTDFVAAQRGQLPAATEWRHVSGDSQGTKYSPLDQISPTNVEQLKVAWRWPSPDRAIEGQNLLWRPTKYQDTPLLIDGTLYTVTSLGIIAALDPGTGQTRWVYDPQSYKGFEGRPANGIYTNRGMGFWTDGRASRLFIGTVDAYLLSIDPSTGKPDPAFGQNGRVDLVEYIRNAVRGRNFTARRPTVAGDVVIVGSNQADSSVRTDSAPPGYLQAFDARTGKRLWTFHTVPRAGEFGYDTWLDGSAEYSGNANIWAGMTYDRDLDYLYFASSTPNSDFYGGHRPGNNLFAESVVCVEARTGKRVWHFQAVHHGLWDYDLPAEPVLGDITVDGRRIEAVMVVSKQAFTYVFDRRTGASVWPIEERPVPQSSVPGERTSPTQPFPTKPASFDRQGTTEDNLIDFTPELKKEALKRLDMFEHGPLFTPPSLKGTVFLPGVWGGARWGGAAFDPETGWLYVASVMIPSVSRLVPSDSAQTDIRYRGGGGAANQNLFIEDLSIFKPPYSRVTAIDMNRGEHRWMAPLGNGPVNHPLLKNLKLGPLGNATQHGHLLVTKSVLFVTVTYMTSPGDISVPTWAKWGDPDLLRKLMYVFDKNSGKLLRVVELDNAGAAQPMTYLYGGKQYVVVATGGPKTAELVALSIL